MQREASPINRPELLLEGQPETQPDEIRPNLCPDESSRPKGDVQRELEAIDHESHAGAPARQQQVPDWQRFIEAVFAGTTHQIEVRVIGAEVNRVFTRDMLVISTFVEEHAGQNTFFGVATREGGKGKKENCREVSALWVDVDFKTTSPQELKRKLSGLAIRPSACVLSGGGAHLYWLLDKPYPAHTTIERYLRALATTLGADGAAAELARVLRLPDTLNSKYKPARKVRLSRLYPERRYELAEFDFLLKEAVAEKATQHLDQDGLPQDVPEGHRNPTLMSLAGGMRRQGMGEKAIRAALLAVNEQRCRPPLSEAEVFAIARSVIRYPAGAPSNSNQLLRVPDVICLADVPPEQVKFLWNPYIPQGKITLLIGDPSAGKTFISLKIAAELTTGAAETIKQPLGDVLFLSAEDGLGDTIRPRFDKLGGDPKRFHVLRGVLLGNDKKQVPITLADVDVLAATLEQTRARLVVVDPFQGYLGAGVDLHRSNETRPVLAGLAALAEKFGCAIVLIEHMTKGGRARSIYRALGSIDIVAAARSVLLAGADCQNATTRAVVHIKSSLAKAGGSVGYSLTEDGVLKWEGPSGMTAEDILGSDSPKPSPKRSQAEEFLLKALAHGPRPSAEVEEEAKAAGISERTLDRARQKLKLVTTKDTFGGGWIIGRPSEGVPSTCGTSFLKQKEAALWQVALQEAENLPRTGPQGSDMTPFAGVDAVRSKVNGNGDLRSGPD